MSKPKISVIIPVYNVEDYLSEALDSILNQTMIDDLEVIMVDDGSTDESRFIIEEYAADHENFHVYRKENEGQGIARNYGLKLAKGDYIHFMDSDDYIPPKAYETLYSLAVKNDCDIAAGYALRFARYNIWNDDLFINGFRGVDEVIDRTTLEEMPSLVWDTVTWNKLYRREFLMENGIEFPHEKISYQDIPFSLEAYILAETISITPEVCYYWRLRSNRSSATQQDLDIKNVKNRLKVLRWVQDIMYRYDVSTEIAYEEYMKWIDHDLKFFIKRFHYYPKKYQWDLFEEMYGLVKHIPANMIEDSNSYKKAVFIMILYNDLKNFMYLAPLENYIYENPRFPGLVDAEYERYFNFDEAIKEEELIADLKNVTHDGSHIYMEFDGKLNYLSRYTDYEVTANVIENYSRYPLEVSNNKIIMPIAIIRDKEHVQIELCYTFRDIEKTCFLKTRNRQSLEFDDFFMDLNMGIDSYLYIDIKNKSDNLLEITKAAYEDGQFILGGTSQKKVDSVYLENVVSFERIVYPVEYGTTSNVFTFRISEKDLENAPIKKWEINCEESPNSIRLASSFKFYKSHNKIRFINSRNKILIENDICNGHVEILYEILMN